MKKKFATEIDIMLNGTYLATYSGGIFSKADIERIKLTERRMARGSIGTPCHITAKANIWLPKEQALREARKSELLI